MPNTSYGLQSGVRRRMGHSWRPLHACFVCGTLQQSLRSSRFANWEPTVFRLIWTNEPMTLKCRHAAVYLFPSAISECTADVVITWITSNGLRLNSEGTDILRQPDANINFSSAGSSIDKVSNRCCNVVRLWSECKTFSENHATLNCRWCIYANYGRRVVPYQWVIIVRGFLDWITATVSYLLWRFHWILKAAARLIFKLPSSDHVTDGLIFDRVRH